jgi:hypothetical protein
MPFRDEPRAPPPRLATARSTLCHPLVSWVTTFRTILRGSPPPPVAIDPSFRTLCCRYCSAAFRAHHRARTHSGAEHGPARPSARRLLSTAPSAPTNDASFWTLC